MRLPFTTEQFFDVFRRYNEAVWPMQWLLVALAVGALVLALRGTPRGSRAAAAILAILWLWMAAAYHVAFFSAINPAAFVFAALCLVQAGLFAWVGVWRTRLAFHPPTGLRGVLGSVILTYALVGYPVLGQAQGHRYPDAPTFGLPCPTTLFTLGLLLWAVPRAPRLVLVIPVLWALIGTLAATQLGVWEDLGLAVAAVVTVVLALPSGWRTGGYAGARP